MNSGREGVILDAIKGEKEEPRSLPMVSHGLKRNRLGE